MGLMATCSARRAANIREALSEADRAPVRARIASPAQNAIRAAQDDLPTPEQRALMPADCPRAMPHRRKLADDAIGNSLLSGDAAAGCPIFNAHARQVERRLRIEAVVLERDHDLGVALRLHEP